MEGRGGVQSYTEELHVKTVPRPGFLLPHPVGWGVSDNNPTSGQGCTRD